MHTLLYSNNLDLLYSLNNLEHIAKPQTERTNL